MLSINLTPSIFTAARATNFSDFTRGSFNVLAFLISKYSISIFSCFNNSLSAILSSSVKLTWFFRYSFWTNFNVFEISIAYFQIGGKLDWPVLFVKHINEKFLSLSLSFHWLVVMSQLLSLYLDQVLPQHTPYHRTESARNALPNC